MTDGDITLLAEVYSINNTKGRLYYYQGNFFMPLILRGDQSGRVKRAMRVFTQTHRKMIDDDRADQNYKTLMELFDEQINEGEQNE